MADLEERISEDIELQPHIWWMYINDIFCILEHGEYYLKQFIETLNAFNPSIKFNAKWSNEKINFLDFNVGLRNRQFKTDLHIKPILHISFLTQHLVTLTTVRKVYPIVRL